MSDDLRAKVERHWHDWLALLDRAPDDRKNEPGVTGEWSVKDLMAHIAYWDDRAAIVIGHGGRGEEVPPIDWQKVNDELASERAGWSLENAEREMRAAHGRMLATLDAYPDVGDEYVAGNTWEHYDEHAAEIRAWLE